MARASGIAAVGEPPGGVGGCDGGEGVPGGGAEVVVGASPSPPQHLLGLGEGLLDGVEVGRVGWKQQDPGTTLLDGGTAGRAAMGREIVSDDHLARPEGRCQAKADVAL